MMCSMFGFLSRSGIILIGAVNFPYRSRIYFSTFESTTFFEGFDKGSTGKNTFFTTRPFSSSSSTIETALKI